MSYTYFKLVIQDFFFVFRMKSANSIIRNNTKGFFSKLKTMKNLAKIWFLNLLSNLIKWKHTKNSGKSKMVEAKRAFIELQNVFFWRSCFYSFLNQSDPFFPIFSTDYSRTGYINCTSSRNSHHGVYGRKHWPAKKYSQE